jgi:hypothetical protein
MLGSMKKSRANLLSSLHRLHQERRRPQTLFLFNDEKEGRRKCKLVRRADEAWMLRAGECYREFREDLKQLRAIDLEEKRILMALAEVRAIRYE